jgi:hypothetical protein
MAGNCWNGVLKLWDANASHFNVWEPLCTPAYQCSCWGLLMPSPYISSLAALAFLGSVSGPRYRRSCTYSQRTWDYLRAWRASNSLLIVWLVVVERQKRGEGLRGTIAVLYWSPPVVPRIQGVNTRTMQTGATAANGTASTAPLLLY